MALILHNAKSPGMGPVKSLTTTRTERQRPVNRIRAAVLMGVALAVASPAIANQIQVGYQGSDYGRYQTGEGGEFTLSVVNPEEWLDLSGYVSGTSSELDPSSEITSFQTFCIEFDEFIYPNATYNAQLNTNAVEGGVG